MTSKADLHDFERLYAEIAELRKDKELLLAYLEKYDQAIAAAGFAIELRDITQPKGELRLIPRMFQRTPKTNGSALDVTG